MTQINLLPWREQARQEKKIQFLITLGLCVGFSIFIIILIHIYLNSLVNNENSRIAFLQTELGNKQAEFRVLKNKQLKQDEIEANLKFLVTLRNKSFQSVNLMNELIKLVPQTITLEKLTRENNKIIIVGKTQSEVQITLFMKNIAKSNVLNQPILTRINENPGGNSDSARLFELQVQLKNGASP
jgi:type IV pilus assembly protein PilN